MHSNSNNIFAFTPPANPSVFLKADDGGRLGGFAGLVFAPQMFGLQNVRVEGAVSYTNFKDDEKQGPANSGAVIPNGGGFLTFGNPVRATLDRDVLDASLAFKGDFYAEQNISITAVLEAFFRHSDSNLFFGSAPPPLGIRSELLEDSFGGMVGLQPEFPITPEVSIVAGLAGGVYYYRAESDSRLDLALGAGSFANQTSKSGWGFRGRAKGGLKIKWVENASVNLFGGVEYLSKVASLNPSRAVGQTSGIKMIDNLEVTGGVSVTVNLFTP